jgi:hypothetical protein
MLRQTDWKEDSMRTGKILRFPTLIVVLLIFASALPVQAHGEGSIALPIDTPAEAHEAVLATGAPFDDFVFLDGGLIGASQYFEVKGDLGSGATWVVTYTHGWGDCQAGCISRHTFFYLVDPVTGDATFDRQEGDALPAEAPESLRFIEALDGVPSGVLPISDVTPVASDAPGADDPDWGAMYEEWYEDFIAGLEPCAPGADPTDPALMTCLLPDGSVAGPMPLFAPAPGPIDGGESHGDDGWIHELPMIILAVLLAWVGGAALVGWRKSRAS